MTLESYLATVEARSAERTIHDIPPDASHPAFLAYARYGDEIVVLHELTGSLYVCRILHDTEIQPNGQHQFPLPAYRAPIYTLNERDPEAYSKWAEAAERLMHDA